MPRQPTAARRGPRRPIDRRRGSPASASSRSLLGIAGLPRLQPLVGLALILAIAYCLLVGRRAIDWRTVGWGLGLQFVFALIVLKTTVGQRGLRGARRRDHAGCSTSPSSARRSSSARSATAACGGGSMTGVLGAEGAQYGVIFAFQVLPTIIFIAALFAILYYFGVMQLVVRFFAVVMRRFMRASGAESLNVAASIFMGQTEAPLTIRPFLPKMTESELMTVMTAGMAHISGGIMAAYILFGIEAQHLLTAVIMTAPGTLMMAKMFVPETERAGDDGRRRSCSVEKTDVNVIDAAGRGTSEGLHLALNVGAMLISFLALVALVNAHARLRARPGRGSLSLQRSSAGCSRRSRGPWACRGRTRRRSATCSARAWC